MADQLTTTEAVAALEALANRTDDTADHVHILADEILLASVDTAVRDAYERLIASRNGDWYYA